jgi:hypothetical protein
MDCLAEVVLLVLGNNDVPSEGIWPRAQRPREPEAVGAEAGTNESFFQKAIFRLVSRL